MFVHVATNITELNLASLVPSSTSTLLSRRCSRSLVSLHKCHWCVGTESWGIVMSGGMWMLVGFAVKTASLVWKLEVLVALLRIYQI